MAVERRKYTKNALPGPLDSASSRSQETPLFANDLQEPFLSNPFGHLRLGAAASVAEIQAALAQARVEARLSSTFDPETGLDRVRRAQTQLLDSSSRERHAEAWFYDPSAPMFAGRFEANDEVLKGYEEKSHLGGAQGARYQHDAANWYLALAIHANEPGQIESLITTALEKWSLLLTSSDYLAIQGPAVRISPKGPSQWPEHVIGALSAANVRHCASGETENVVACLNALRALGCQREVILLALESVLSHLSQRVASELGNAQVSETATVPLANSLADEALPLFELLTALGDDASSQHTSVLDDVCSFLRSMAISLHNERNETKAAIEVMECALDLALGVTEEKLQEDLANLQEQLKEQLFVANFSSLNIKPIKSAPPLYTINGCGLRLYGEGEYDQLTSSYVVNHYFTLLWIPILPLGRYRVRSAGQNRYQFLGRVPFRRPEKIHLSLGLAAIIVALVSIAVAASADNSQSYNRSGNTPSRNVPSFNNPVINPVLASTTVPTVVRPTSTPDTRAASRERLRSQIDANTARLDQLGSQVDGLDRTLSGLNGQLSSLESQMTSITRTYAVGNTLPEPQYSQYERLRSQYSALVAQYNSTLSQRNSLAKQHDDLLVETNRLVDQYNAIR